MENECLELTKTEAADLLDSESRKIEKNTTQFKNIFFKIVTENNLQKELTL